MKNIISRRALLGSALAGGAVACSRTQNGESFSVSEVQASARFAHGVASGDPLQNSVVIWTRITPDNPQETPEITVRWQIARDAEFKEEVGSGETKTNGAKNWTVKVVPGGLPSGSEFFYRFQTGEDYSPTGQTRTLPEGPVNKARFAIVSCSNWQQGYFNAYDHIARQNDGPGGFDALIHLGDYFYEYGPDKASTHMREAGRLHEPPREIIKLADYRRRHAQYRSDPSLQAVTAKMPIIPIWDDHESSNDSWTGGAENHQDDEGDWKARKAAALRAYYEWMPVRNPEPGRTRASFYRSFEWGDLLTMAAIETRLLARGEPVIIDEYFDLLRSEGGTEKFKSEILNDPNRNMLGAQQLEFVSDTFKASKQAGKPWRVLANQVVMGRVMTPDLTPHVDESAMQLIEEQWSGIRDFVELSQHSLPVYPDSWDGYPQARENLYTALENAGVRDMLVVTGDAHEFWINDLTSNAGTKMGVEVGTTSVSSETLAAFLGDASEDYALLMTQVNPDVRYYNALHNGYTDITFRPHEAAVKLVAVDTVASTDYSVVTAAEFSVRPNDGSLKVGSPKGLNLKQRALFSGLGD